MPCKSKKQCQMMGMVAAGKIKKPGLSKEKAGEYVRGVKVSRLPKYAKKKK